MTRRERLIHALNHKETDVIPYQINFTHQARQKVAEYLGDENFVEKIGNHIESVYFDGFLSEEKDNPGFFKDDFGVIWNRTGTDKDIGVIDGIVIKEPDISSYKFPEVKYDILHSEFEKLMNNGKDTFKMGAIGFTLFERAWTLRGMENILADMLLYPDFADALLDEICDFNLKIVDIALEYDIDGFEFGDDWGQQAGLIMGPRLWRRFFLPRVARMFERVKSKGKFIILHSCGDIGEILPDLIDIGLDVYQTFQPEIYDIKTIKREYGKNLSFWGGISTQRLLPFASPEEIKSKTTEIMKIMGQGGGYIAGPTHDVPGDVPPKNIIAMMDVFQNQKLYL